MSTISTATERRTRLWMVVHAYYPIGEPRVQREARAAHDFGYEVTVICLRSHGESPRERIDGVDVRRLPLRHVRGARISRILFEYVAFTVLATITLGFAAARRTCDVVQIHAPPDFLTLAGLFPKLSGARLVLDIHDLSAHLYSARFTGLLGAAISRSLTAIQRIACRIADHVITVHEPYRLQLLNDGVDGRKVTIVMNSVDLSLLEDLAHGISVGGCASDDSFILAYHGTLTHWYGVDLLLKAMVHLGDCLPHARALVLGDGDALQALKELATESGLGDRVEFSGRYLSINETLTRVARTHCGVIPNRATTLNRFALSSKLFEYIAMRVPVVVARLETLTRHFRPDEVTFFEPDDALSLAEAIRWVAEHPHEAAAKAQRASARAQEYSWERNRARYATVLGES